MFFLDQHEDVNVLQQQIGAACNCPAAVMDVEENAVLAKERISSDAKLESAVKEG